jgi:GR25 family glycosyltransferase involved in LPS biosynthesis
MMSGENSAMGSKQGTLIKLVNAAVPVEECSGKAESFSNKKGLIRPIPPAVINWIGELFGPGGVYVISLKWRAKSLKRTIDRLDRAGIGRSLITPIRAVDGLAAGVKEMGKFRRLQGQYGFGSLKKELGQAGLIATSVKLWADIIEQRRPWSLIVEDDIELDPQAAMMLHTAWHQWPLAKNASIVYLGWCHAYRGKRVVFDQSTPKTPNLCYSLKIFDEFPECTHAYLLSLEGARQLHTHFTRRPSPAALDIEMNHLKPGANGYTVVGISSPLRSTPSKHGIVRQMPVGPLNPSDIPLLASDIDTCNTIEKEATEMFQRAGVGGRVESLRWQYAGDRERSGKARTGADIHRMVGVVAGVGGVGAGGTGPGTATTSSYELNAAVAAAAQRCFATATSASASSNTATGGNTTDTNTFTSLLGLASRSVAAPPHGYSLACSTMLYTQLRRAIALLLDVSRMPCGEGFIAYASGVRAQTMEEVGAVASAVVAAMDRETKRWVERPKLAAQTVQALAQAQAQAEAKVAQAAAQKLFVGWKGGTCTEESWCVPNLARIIDRKDRDHSTGTWCVAWRASCPCTCASVAAAATTSATPAPRT